jgi:hypothetical protein
MQRLAGNEIDICFKIDIRQSEELRVETYVKFAQVGSLPRR